jgi:hypothetical protein
MQLHGSVYLLPRDHIHRCALQAKRLGLRMGCIVQPRYHPQDPWIWEVEALVYHTPEGCDLFTHYVAVQRSACGVCVLRRTGNTGGLRGATRTCTYVLG